MEPSKADIELPSKMAHLDIMEEDEGNGSSQETQNNDTTSRRVLRKRVWNCKSTKRLVNMKPVKRTTEITDKRTNEKKIKDLYLNKKVKSSTQTLETIYEEPKTDTKSSTEVFIGGRKVKRLLTFQLGSQYTKEKVKKRRAKIKKFLGNKSFLNRKKIPMQEFLKTIECMELDEAVEGEIKILTDEGKET